MSDVIKALSNFWRDWGPWITVSLIPTIITGLSLSPRTAPAATAVQKVWDSIKKILDFLSVAKFKDAPGTFQLPLKMGKVAHTVKLKMAGPAKKPPASSGVALLLIATLVHASSGCAWIHSTGKQIGSDAIDCAVEAVRSNAAHLLPIVKAIITGEAPNWAEMLTAFVKEFGRDAVACALQQASSDIQASSPAAGTATGDAQLQGLTKARTYIDDQKWSFKHPAESP